MRFGAMNFPVKPVIDEIEEIAGCGLDYLELTLDPPEAHFSRVRELKKDILETLSARGMGLICHMPTFVYTADLTESIREASLDEMRHSLDIAADLDAEKVVLHPAYRGGLGVFVADRVRRYADEALAAILERAGRLGLRICLENMFPAYQVFFEPKHFNGVLKSYPDLYLTLDTGHANIGDPGGGRVIDFIRRFGHRIGHVHASDNSGKRDDHLSIGKGTIDFPRVVNALRKSGYDDTITLEIFSENRRELKQSLERMTSLLGRTP